MLTEKDYCDYDTCVALKELGYNEKSNWWFSKYLNEDSGQMELVHICDNPAHLNYDSWGIVPKDFVIRPSLYETQKWLREEKGFDIVITPVDKCTTFIGGERYFSMLYRNQERVSSLDVPCTITYEESLLARIKEAVKILKEEK